MSLGGDNVSPDSLRLRILVVDPAGEAGGTLVEAVRRWGHEMRSVRDDASAFAALATFRPEVLLVVADAQERVGLLVAQRIRRMEPVRPILVGVSATPESGSREREAMAPFDHSVAWPDDREWLAHFLRAVARTAMPGV